uniref:Uncharacterized protein n=1 Tax=Arundo donax TaxID=35708 RepID=A0A0A9TNQ6_ARUDO
MLSELQTYCLLYCIQIKFISSLIGVMPVLLPFPILITSLMCSTSLNVLWSQVSDHTFTVIYIFLSLKMFPKYFYINIYLPLHSKISSNGGTVLPC